MTEPIKNPLLLDVPTRLETERLLLRALQPGDGEALEQAVRESREALHPWLALGEQVSSPADAEALARRAWASFVQREAFRFGVWRQQDEQFVGTWSLHYGNWSVPSFEIGGWVRASLTNQGYATEAARALIDFAFEQLGVVRLEIRFDHRNVRSQHIADKLDFLFEARLRSHHVAPDGELVDEMVYAKLREDWEHERQNLPAAG